MHQIRFPLGFCRRPSWGITALFQPPAVFKGFTSTGGRRGEEGEGKESGRKGKGKERKEEGREGGAREKCEA